MTTRGRRVSSHIGARYKGAPISSPGAATKGTDLPIREKGPKKYLEF